jgi:hypothetical protein
MQGNLQFFNLIVPDPINTGILEGIVKFDVFIGFHVASTILISSSVRS